MEVSKATINIIKATHPAAMPGWILSYEKFIQKLQRQWMFKDAGKHTHTCILTYAYIHVLMHIFI